MQIASNGSHLEVVDDGPTGGETVLLVMGLGMQLTAWPDRLVRDLVRRGLRVLRLDNRDAGLSTSFDAAGMPNLVSATLRYALRRPVPTVYTLADMARDAVGVLDALGIARVHVCGASMGGMIAQHLAASHPERVASLTLVMTSSGARHLPPPRAPVRRLMMRRVPATAPRDAIVAHLERIWLAIASPGHPPDRDELRRRLVATVERAWRPAGTARQLVAIAADGDRPALLRRIRAPTQVVHGEDDPLIPVAAALDLHERIAGSTLDRVPGMGHDLPDALMPRLAEAIATGVARAAADTSGS